MTEQSKEINVFHYQGHNLRAKMVDGDPWFVGKDACQMLDIKNVSDALAKLDEDEKGIGQIDTLGGSQSTLLISLPGLQKLIFRSDKPEANKITRWVTHEVLPSIYKTGSYSIGQSHSSLDISYHLTGSTPQDIKRDQAILAHLQHAQALLASKRNIQEEKAPRNVTAIMPAQKRSLEEKILQYIREHQHITHDTDQLPTMRNLSRATRKPVEELKNDIQDLLDQGKIETFQAGKARCYRLAA